MQLKFIFWKLPGFNSTRLPHVPCST